ncbi:hypothetical protein [Siminovitchia acidinfaciens]|uniref:hypothetical protein n=1 Tax=Siminovitchia acidinfaciens TaxID=2321395 RepID=UPI001F1CDCD4|nr:hypothetical protein [Siminovitchia acidinfaciens]
MSQSMLIQEYRNIREKRGLCILIKRWRMPAMFLTVSQYYEQLKWLEANKQILFSGSSPGIFFGKPSKRTARLIGR